MTNDPAILARGLTKHYGDVEALNDLDLEVQKGEVFGFLGPNGAGKTTTIRTILDEIRPTAGTASILGMDSRGQSVEIRRHIGYVLLLHLGGRLHFDQVPGVIIDSLQHIHSNPDTILEKRSLVDCRYISVFQNF